MNMKEKVFIGLLLIVEVVVFYTLMYVLNIPDLLIFKLGLIWFFFAFLFNHFKMESSLSSLGNSEQIKKASE